MKSLRCLLALALLSFGSLASAQGFPNKPVRIIVPFPAGGSMDAVARITGQKLAEKWKQSVVVENRPGAASVIGTNLLAKAAADGYTIGMEANGFTINPSLYKTLPYDTVKDFAPITYATFTPNVLVANPSVRANDLAELRALALAKPGELTVGSIGNGTASHLAIEGFKVAAKVNILHVPYQGLAPGVMAVLGGQTNLMMANLPDVLPYIKSGQLRAIAVSSEKRHPLAPTVPTFVESGFPDFVSGAWYGFLSPAGTPKAIIDKISADIVATLKDPDVCSRFEKLGLDCVGTTPEEFQKILKSEMERNAKLVKASGATVD